MNEPPSCSTRMLALIFRFAAGWSVSSSTSVPRKRAVEPIVKTMRKLYAQCKLDDAQSKIMASTRPAEELYDLKKDPHELDNLAGDTAHADRLMEMRGALRDWIKWSGDRGERPEPAAFAGLAGGLLAPISRADPTYPSTRWAA